MGLPAYSSLANSPFGGPQNGVTIGGVQYIVDGPYQAHRVTREIRRNDANGDRSDFEERFEPSTLPLKLQLAASTTTTPLMGVTWAGPDGTGTITSTVGWVVTKAGVAYEQGGYWYVDIDNVSLALPTS